MTVLDSMIRGARSFAANVTVNGDPNRLMPLNGAGRAISLVGDRHATFEELYRTQPWVQVVVNRLARGIGRLPIKVFVNPDEPAERERVRDGALAELLARPGERSGPNRLIQSIVSNVAVHGNHVLIKRSRRPGVPPFELLSYNALYWSARRDGDGNLWYIFSPGTGQPLMFRPEEVIHFRWWEGGAGIWAQSPLEALRSTLISEDSTQRFIIASFENGARPSGIYSIKGNIDKDTIQRGREELHRIFGGVDNTAKLAVVAGDGEWSPLSHTIVDSDLINLRKLDREEVAAVYNVPPPVVGILDRATFSNISEQHLMEATDTMQPWTAMIQEELSIQLIAPEPLMAGQYVEFEFGALLAGDPTKQMEVLTKATGRPIFTPNEARARLNMPPLFDPEADQLAPVPNASVKGGASGDGSR